MDELREVTRYVVESAAHVQDVFQRAHPQDPRVGAALDAAPAFADGGLRSKRLRTASIDAHRAAKDASSEAARLAARAAGDAAAAAYLHPIARAHQVGHILRAAACAARIVELTAGDDPTAAARVIEDATLRATPVLVDVLSRYPTPPTGRNRVEQLVSALDTSLRAHPDQDRAQRGSGLRAAAHPGRSHPARTLTGGGHDRRGVRAMILPKVRDPRFITVRRGGTLSDADHHLLALWAAACAEHVLLCFESVQPDDPRPRQAIEHARAWVNGAVTMMQARAAGGHAMGAARELRGAARHAAYAAGQAGAVAHVAAHELGAAAYAIKAARAAAPEVGSESAGRLECQWQREQLPEAIRELVLDDQQLRNDICWSVFTR